ncbi:MAG: GDP-L-fucose synthase [Pseudomonadota bacterium]
MEHLNARIFVAGHRGMVGSAIVRLLNSRGYRNIVTRTHAELDLTDQAQVRSFFSSEKIEQVYLAAARVGGIHANNSYPANFIYENMMMQANIIHEAWRHDIRKLLFLGSSCIYPRLAAQPMREDSLMMGQLEPTNEAYAIAKIAGIKLCESYNRQHGTDYRSVMPTNLYGPGDNYHPENSHVIPGLIRRFHEAKIANAEKVVVWGSGTPQREFLHVDDMALASLHVMGLDRARYEAATQPMQSHLNVGSGEELSIGELAKTVMQVVGFQGRLEFDTTKPDGTPRKLLDVSRLASLGWAPGISLKAGLAETYQAFVAGAQLKPSAGSV